MSFVSEGAPVKVDGVAEVVVVIVVAAVDSSLIICFLLLLPSTEGEITAVH